MDASLFDPSRFHVAPTAARNQKEDLIEQIVARTSLASEPERRVLAKQLAIAGNTLGWTVMDLHALLKKADDPTIRNYAAFVKWSCKVMTH